MFSDSMKLRTLASQAAAVALLSACAAHAAEFASELGDEIHFKNRRVEWRRNQGLLRHQDNPATCKSMAIRAVVRVFNGLHWIFKSDA